MTDAPVASTSQAVAVSRADIQTSHRGRRYAWTPYLFLTPYFVITALFFLYPLAYGAILAFYQTNGSRGRVFNGLDNFSFIFHDSDFWISVRNTVFFTLCSIFIQLPLSLGLALLLNKRQGRSRAFFRLAIFAPNLVGQVFVGIMFAMLFTARYGLFNRFLQALIGWGLEQQWLADPSLVMPAVVIAAMWMYVGFNMVYFLAALQNVDQSLVEAARIDGAGSWSVFRNVTLPSISHVATFVVVTSTIGSFQLFELPYTLLQQFESNAGFGPKNSGMTIVGYLYNQGIISNDLGLASAVGWILTSVILVVSLVQIRITAAVGSDQ
jgi:ABC-type sugar transport system permease subunit